MSKDWNTLAPQLVSRAHKVATAVRNEARASKLHPFLTRDASHHYGFGDTSGWNDGWCHASALATKLAHPEVELHDIVTPDFERFSDWGSVHHVAPFIPSVGKYLDFNHGLVDSSHFMKEFDPEHDNRVEPHNLERANSQFYTSKAPNNKLVHIIHRHLFGGMKKFEEEELAKAKPPGPVIGHRAVKVIEKLVDATFDRAKARVLGHHSFAKRVGVGFAHELTLPGLFEAASSESGIKPDMPTLKQMLDIAGGYIDATRERTKARVVKEVTAFLSEAHAKGVRTDLKTVLGGALQEVFGDAAVSMRRIVDTEANNVKNVGILDGIVRINATSGVDDPIVYWVSVNDSSRCDECTRLHTTDGATPRLWYLSEVGHGYHKKGEPNPKIGGLHPNCRCTMATLMEGYGFDAAGRVTYITRGHSEMKKQRP